MDEEQKPIVIGEELGIRDEKGRFIEGHPDLGAGRPAGSFSLKTLLEQEIQKQSKGKQRTFALSLIKRQLYQAINEGDQQTQKLIWNYLEGLPLARTDFTSGGKPLLTKEQIDELLFRRTGENNAGGSVQPD